VSKDVEQRIKLDVPAVRLENVGKSFLLDEPSDQRRFFWQQSPGSKKLFWALNDVSFEVNTGRALGILGLNGAGKSTLLNIIAGILQPTKGILHINGRVQLLQLGAGFVPELSGRQNVVVHARTRSLSAEEIEHRVAYVKKFADIGPFFDQPMRTYSSGMKGRVAFGNAFAVDPEILIVDEALAVGDAVFANKCFRKIQEIREKGTTILFTSHSSESVLRLCDDGIVLHRGEILAAGSAREAAKAYTALIMGNAESTAPLNMTETENLTAISESIPIDASSATDRQEVNGPTPPEDFAFSNSDGIDRMTECPFYNPQETIFGKGGARLVECAVRVDEKVSKNSLIPFGSKIELYIRVFFDEAVRSVNFGFTLNDSEDVVFYGTNQLWLGEVLPAAAAQCSRTYRIEFPAMLANGDWFISPAIADDLTVLQQRAAALHFKVLNAKNACVGKGWLDLELGAVEGAS